MRWGLIGIALSFLGVFLLTPLLVLLYSAFHEGWHLYQAAVLDHETISAVKLTLFAVLCAVPLNMIFGISAA